MAETISLPTPDGPMPTHVATPMMGTPRGGAIVLHDAFGLSGYVEDVCRRLSDAGWLAVAPALFHRTGSPVLPWDGIAEAGPHLGALTGAGILADVDACTAHLAALAVPVERTAVVGFCLGGTIGMYLASERAFGAISAFYGHALGTAWDGVPSAVDRVGAFGVPLLALFGDADAMIPVEEVEALRSAAASVPAPVPVEVVRYPEANHAFHRDVTPDWYHEASAVDAWARTLDWFERHIPLPAPVTAPAAQV